MVELQRLPLLLPPPLEQLAEGQVDRLGGEGIEAATLPKGLALVLG